MANVTFSAADVKQSVMPVVRLGTSEDVAVGASVSQSTAAPAGTTVARIYADVDCRIAVGSDPQPVNSSACFMPAGSVMHAIVQAGEKVGFIQPA